MAVADDRWPYLALCAWLMLSCKRMYADVCTTTACREWQTSATAQALQYTIDSSYLILHLIQCSLGAVNPLCL